MWSNVSPLTTSRGEFTLTSTRPPLLPLEVCQQHGRASKSPDIQYSQQGFLSLCHSPHLIYPSQNCFVGTNIFPWQHMRWPSQARNICRVMVIIADTHWCDVVKVRFSKLLQTLIAICAAQIVDLKGKVCYQYNARVVGHVTNVLLNVVIHNGTVISLDAFVNTCVWQNSSDVIADLRICKTVVGKQCGACEFRAGTYIDKASKIPCNVS